MATNTAIAERYITGREQTAQRAPKVWFDQHRNPAYVDARGKRIFKEGRPWFSTIELRSGMPVGPIAPLGWTAPYLPPQPYLVAGLGKASPLEDLDLQFPANMVQATDKFRIDYALMLRDMTQRTERFWQRAVQSAADHNLPMPEPGARMDRRLRLVVGNPPLSPKVAEAFLAGNPFLLGFQPESEDDADLVRLLRGELIEADADADAREATDVPDVAEAQALLDAALEARAEMAAMLAEMKAERAKGPARSGRKRKAPEAEG